MLEHVELKKEQVYVYADETGMEHTVGQRIVEPEGLTLIRQYTFYSKKED